MAKKTIKEIKDFFLRCDAAKSEITRIALRRWYSVEGGEELPEERPEDFEKYLEEVREEYSDWLDAKGDAWFSDKWGIFHRGNEPWFYDLTFEFFQKNKGYKKEG